MLLVANHGHALVARQLERELASVENICTAQLHSDLACVNQLVKHVERYRGKMLRPSLLLASGMAADAAEQGLTDKHRHMAAVVELIHMATLVHDDVLDDAEVRRRGLTVNRLAGNETAVMLGDLLFCHANLLVADLADAPIAAALSRATNLVCEGELLQLANRNRWDLEEETYFNIIRRKTAALCAVACRIGAMLSQADPGNVAALESYGESIGVAFQIADDLLDLTGEEAVVGKTLGRDLQKGKLTLPLIHHLRMQTGSNGTIRKLLTQRPVAEPAEMCAAMSAQQAESIRQSLQETGSLEYARVKALACIAQAKTSLSSLPPTPAREFLMDVAEAVVLRES